MVRDQQVVRENHTQLRGHRPARVGGAGLAQDGQVARRQRVDDDKEIVVKLFDLGEMRRRSRFATQTRDVLQGERVYGKALLVNESFFLLRRVDEVDP